jgi:hypothetical protein
MSGVELATTADIAQASTVLRAEIAAARTELKADIAALRAELKADIAAPRGGDRAAAARHDDQARQHAGRRGRRDLGRDLVLAATVMARTAGLKLCAGLAEKVMIGP